jgi:hypothetical protein
MLSLMHNLESFDFLSLIPILSCFLLGIYPYILRSRRIYLDMFMNGFKGITVRI